MSTIPGCEAWSKDGGPLGVLVLHGITGCPQSMRPLAEAFAAAGYTVELPLLPGHGTTVEDMLPTRWADWTAAAESAYQSLAASCDKVVVAGLSMGGSLTAWLASRHDEIAGIVCINPVLEINDALVDLVRQTLDSGEETIPIIGGDIADPEGHETVYDKTPLRPLLSLADGLRELEADLGRISCPLLLLTSPQDHTVPPTNSDMLAATVAGAVQRMSLERSYHVATQDYDRDLVCAESVAFAARL